MEARNKNILIGGLLAIVLVMAVGYAAFATTLNITGTAKIDSTWDVEITNIEVDTANTYSKTTGDLVTGNSESSFDETPTTGYPKFTSTTATFFAKLVSPGDYVTYKVTVKNLGNVKANLKSIAWQEENAETGVIQYSFSGIAANSTLDVKDAANNADTVTFSVKVMYADTTDQGQPAAADLKKTATLVLDYEQATA